MKSYTDLEQSKKLAKILSLESADYTRLGKDEDNVLTRSYFESCSSGLGEWIGKDEMSPCWSLASIVWRLPNKIVSHETAFEGEDAEGINDIYYKCIESTEDGRYMCYYSGNGYKYKYVADNPVDACVEMIEKLHELKML